MLKKQGGGRPLSCFDIRVKSSAFSVKCKWGCRFYTDALHQGEKLPLLLYFLVQFLKDEWVLNWAQCPLCIDWQDCATFLCGLLLFSCWTSHTLRPLPHIWIQVRAQAFWWAPVAPPWELATVWGDERPWFSHSSLHPIIREGWKTGREPPTSKRGRFGFHSGLAWTAAREEVRSRFPMVSGWRQGFCPSGFPLCLSFN